MVFASPVAQHVTFTGRAGGAGYPAALLGTARLTPGGLTEYVARTGRELLLHEKAAIGYYLSGHPFTTYERELRSFVTTRLDQLNPQPPAALRPIPQPPVPSRPAPPTPQRPTPPQPFAPQQFVPQPLPPRLVSA